MMTSSGGANWNKNFPAKYVAMNVPSQRAVYVLFTVLGNIYLTRTEKEGPNLWESKREVFAIVWRR